MAKASQRSRRRTKANARRRVRGTAGVSQQSVAAQDQMFFMRLRNHAKWVFVLMAIVFMFSFVVAGVGSGSTGLSNALSSFGSLFGGGGGSNPVKDAQKQVDKAGKDQSKLAPALLALGKAQAAKAKTDDAEKTYARYLQLRPHDANARQELALLYKNAADIPYSQLSATVSDVVQSAPSRLDGGGLVTDPIAAGEHQDAVATASDLWKLYSAAKAQELATLNAAIPDAKGDLKSTVLIQLASEAAIAMNSGITFGQYVPEAPQAANAQTQARQWAAYAKTADEALLKLHPHDSLTKQIKAQLAAVKPYASASGQ